MVDVADLDGRPYEPFLCIGYVKLVLHRIFPDFDSGELPSSNEEAIAWLWREEYPEIEHWREIGTSIFDATKIGDVVYGTTHKGAYVAILVNPAGGGFFTADPERGAHMRHRRALQGVTSVQRRIR